MERDDFIIDANAVVNEIQKEFESDMSHSLEKTVDIWFEDSINLFAEYSKAKG